MKHINHDFINAVKTAKGVYVMARVSGHENHAVLITKAEALRLANGFTDEDEPISWWRLSKESPYIYIG